MAIPSYKEYADVTNTSILDAVDELIDAGIRVHDLPIREAILKLVELRKGYKEEH